MCQKKQKKTCKEDQWSKPKHINAKPYKREKSKRIYDDDEDDYNY